MGDDLPVDLRDAGALPAPPSRGVAALLSLVWPGLGHFYAGHVRAAVILGLVPGVLNLGLGLLARVDAVPLVVSAYGFAYATLLLRAGAAASAALVVPGRRASGWRTVGFLFVSLVPFFLLDVGMRVAVLAPAEVPSEAMQPTLLPGDVVYVAVGAETPMGSVVEYWFDGPNGAGSYLGRVTAVAGQTVPDGDSVPAGSVWITPDNPEFAPVASRMVSVDAIEGRCVGVGWSADPEYGTVRWDRIGLRVEGGR
jgi:hypothetical protein